MQQSVRNRHGSAEPALTAICQAGTDGHLPAGTDGHLPAVDDPAPSWRKKTTVSVPSSTDAAARARGAVTSLPIHSSDSICTDPSTASLRDLR